MNWLKKLFGEKKEKDCCAVKIVEMKEEECCKDSTQS